ncbi:MAG TPA: hypothetical protein VIV11_11605 [Kofleriaceae bacterium]
MRAASSAVYALVVVTLAAATAAADPKAAADVTFQKGRKLMAQKKYAEACDAFAQSHRLDPQFGTMFNLADCEVQLGKLATAWTHYRELARTDTNADRRAVSANIAKKLERRVPKLIVGVVAKPPNLNVTINGTDATSLLDIATPMDFGEHVVFASAPGFREARAVVSINAERQVERVSLRLEPIDARDVPSATVEKDQPPPNRRRFYGTVAMYGGAGLVGVGLVFGGIAYQRWNSANDCTTCTGTEKRDRAHTAVVLGNISTVVVIAGLASAGVGYYLWRTSASSATIVPQVGADHAGASFVGTF